MAIQTAGEQKYYDFIEERAKSLRTGMIVWISLLAVALIATFNSPVIGAVLAAAGVVLAVLNVRSQRALRAKLSWIEDKRWRYLPSVCLWQESMYSPSGQMCLSIASATWQRWK